MKDSFRNNIVKLFSGSLLSQVVRMVSMMLLVRIYQPENFAIYQMFVSTINILAIFATARYENAIIVPKYNWQVSQILFLSLGISILFFVILQICLYFTEIIYFRMYGIYDYIWNYLPIAVLLLSVYSCFYNWYVRERRYTLISIVVYLLRKHINFFNVVILMCIFGIIGILDTGLWCYGIIKVPWISSLWRRALFEPVYLTQCYYDYFSNLGIHPLDFMEFTKNRGAVSQHISNVYLFSPNGSANNGMHGGAVQNLGI